MDTILVPIYQDWPNFFREDLLQINYSFEGRFPQKKLSIKVKMIGNCDLSTKCIIINFNK